MANQPTKAPTVPTLQVVEFDWDWLNEYEHPVGMIGWARQSLKYGQRAVGQYFAGRHYFQFTVKKEQPKVGHPDITWIVTKDSKPFLAGADSGYELYMASGGAPIAHYEQHWDGERWVWRALYKYVKQYHRSFEIPRGAKSAAEFCGRAFHEILSRYLETIKKINIDQDDLTQLKKLLVQRITAHFTKNRILELDGSYVAGIEKAVATLGRTLRDRKTLSRAAVMKLFSQYCETIEQSF